jgi:phospholipase/lecithinase/hemolysin
MSNAVRSGTRILVVACAACWLPAGPVRDTRAGEIYVFGDSLSDTGNLFLLTGGTGGEVFTPDPDQSPRLPTPPYYAGRASNGPVWVELFAERLGLTPPQPVFSGGTNYAFIGAVTGPGSSSPVPIIPSVKAQVDFYLGNATSAAPDDLFVVWGGANDFFYGQTDWTVPVNNLVQAIETLHSQANATRFFVPNLPPLGRTPTGAALDPIGYDLLANEFNTLLDIELDALRHSRELTIYSFDVYTQFELLLADPDAYGLTNVTWTALAVDEDPNSPWFGYPTDPYTLQFDPDTSLFFDGVHPTARGHALLAAAAAASVPEPIAAVLFVTGLLLFAALRGRPHRGRCVR